MTVAAATGSNPQTIREEWSWADIQRFVACLPGARRLEYSGVFGGR